MSANRDTVIAALKVMAETLESKSFLQDAEIHGLSDAAKVVRNKILFIRGAYAKGEYTRLARLFDSVENEIKELVRKQILYLAGRTTPMEIDG